MDTKALAELLKKVQEGSISPDAAMGQMRILPVKELNQAVCDTHRKFRQGFPETIFAEGKTSEQILSIANGLLESSQFVLATRVSNQVAKTLSRSDLKSKYYPDARVFVFGEKKLDNNDEKQISVAVVSAGTSDVPVAEEACVVLEYCGVAINRVYDVGVAGLHRLTERLDEIVNADMVIVVAGMDGALPSVIGGIISGPLIAVPTSVGYGSSFEGLSSLLTMLNSCAAGVTVVNIDNGFGAAMAVLRLCQALKTDSNL